MAQPGLDPLLGIGVPPRLAESSATPDRARFTSALYAAVDQRPPRETSDARPDNGAERTETTRQANDDRREDASERTERDDAAAATSDSDDVVANEPADRDDEAATLTLTTEAAAAEPTTTLESTTIVVAPPDDGAPLAGVETATPELAAETTAGGAFDPNVAAAGAAPGDLPLDASVAGLPTSDSLATDDAAADASAEPSAESLTEDGASGTSAEGAAVGVAGEGPSVQANQSTAENPGTERVPRAGETAPEGRADQQGSGGNGESNSDSDRPATQPTDSAVARDQAGPPADAVLSPEGLQELDEAAGQEIRDDAVTRPEAERSSSTQEVAGSRPWTRLGAPRGLHPAAEAEPPDASVAIDRPRFLQRVSGAIEAADRRGGPISVRLSPPELGSLKIELVMKHGTLAATLETETAAARQVLLDNLPALRARLAEQDIRVEQFDVDVRRDGGEAPDGGPSDRQPGQRPSERRTTQPDPAPGGAETDRGDAIARPGDGDVLDGENLDVHV